MRDKTKLNCSSDQEALGKDEGLCEDVVSEDCTLPINIWIYLHYSV